VLDHVTVQVNTKMQMENAKIVQLDVNNVLVEAHAINVAPILVSKLEHAHASLTIRSLQELHLAISILIPTT